MNQKKRRAIFQCFHAYNPHPTTELIYSSPFELLIAVILSAQATDKSVNKATQILFTKANSPKKIASLGLSGLKKYIKTIGLYNTKAKNIIKTCKILLEEYQGKVPNNRKTANVILNSVFHQPTIAVDTHIFRVCNRTGLAPGKTPLAVEKMLLKVVPKIYLKNAHHWLVLHGRYICLARKPKCPECIIQELCEYPHKTLLK